MPVFFSDADRILYLRILAEESEKARFPVDYYALMDTHVHAIGVPEDEDSLANAIGETHRRYTTIINQRTGTKGFLFQGRFYSCPLDEAHYVAAARYVERNPVRAHMVQNTWDYRWSSARYHCGLVQSDPLIDENADDRNPAWKPYMPSWPELLTEEPSEADVIRKATRTGRPCGSRKFIRELEKLTGRNLLPRKRGPKSGRARFRTDEFRGHKT